MKIKPEYNDWNLLEPVDIFEKLPHSFYTDLQSNKWFERKEALDGLYALLSANPRLCSSISYTDLAQKLARIFTNDSNINVLAMAAKCVAGLARGLREDFAPYISYILPSALLKFKEKKALLRDPLADALDAIGEYCEIDSITYDFLDAMQKSNPSIKTQVDLFIYRYLKRFNVLKASKDFIKAITPLLIKHTAESDAELRNAACMALGAIQKSIGSKAASLLFGSGLVNDKTKMAKIDEACVKAMQEQLESEKLSTDSTSINGGTCKENGASGSSTDVISLAMEIESNSINDWNLLEPVNIFKKLPRSFYTDLQSNKWSERKEALDGLYALLSANPRLCSSISYTDLAQKLARIFTNDSNINVLAMAAKCVAGLARGLREDFAPYISYILPSALLKFKEKKALLRDPLADALDAIGEYCSIGKMTNIILDALKMSNPCIKIQIDLFIYRNLKASHVFDSTKAFIEMATPLIVKHTSESDAELRNAACMALGAIQKSIGSKAAILLFGRELVGDKIKMAKIEEIYLKVAPNGSPTFLSLDMQKNSAQLLSMDEMPAKIKMKRIEKTLPVSGNSHKSLSNSSEMMINSGSVFVMSSPSHSSILANSNVAITSVDKHNNNDKTITNLAAKPRLSAPKLLNCDFSKDTNVRPTRIPRLIHRPYVLN